MNLRRRLRTLFRRRTTEVEMAEEMRFHLEQRAADYADDGLPAAEARLAAQRRFGNTAALQERARDTFGWGALERFLTDLQFAARQLARAPGFTLLAIVTLGLGIGANTAMFSVLNGILLRPLPFADAARLDRLYCTDAQNSLGSFSAADFLDLRKADGPYSQLAAYTTASASLSDPGQPAELALASRATVDLFALLGIQPQLGRNFLPGEDTPGHDRVVILSHRIWRNRYGSRADLIGQTVRIDGEPHTVIGVLPVGFNDWRFMGSIDFYRPLALTPEQATDRKDTPLRVLGRRAPGRDGSACAGFVANLGAELARAFPHENTGRTWTIRPLQRAVAGSSALFVLPMLIGLSGAVLLIACSNLANFLLTRAMARARDFAMRSALGASRLQLLRPLFAEALLLSLAGGGLALLLADWFNQWAMARSTADNGEQALFELDGHVLLWALGASLITAFVFSVAPALFALRLDLNATLKAGGHGSTGGRGQQRFRRLLIIGQFALAMMLLAGAAAFIRGLDDLQHRRAGWESRQVATGTILLPPGAYGSDTKLAAFQQRVLERLAVLPGAESVSLSSFTPFFDWPDVRKLIVEGQPRPVEGRESAAMFNTVSPHYFTTFGTRIVSGRGFTEQDTAGSRKVILLGQTAARAFFGDRDPLGQRLAIATPGQPEWAEIVGVVADIQSADPEPQTVAQRVYLPLMQAPPRQLEIAVRTRGIAPADALDSIRQAMAELDPDLPIRSLVTADAFIDRTFYQLRFLRDMLTGFGLLGLILASVGIYGVIARTTAQRAGEFAVRLALGAPAREITRLVFGTGVRQALIGSALGVVGAVAVTRLIGSAFPGIRADNPWVLAGTCLFLIGIALLACWLPARRAGRIDAISALRAE